MPLLSNRVAFVAVLFALALGFAVGHWRGRSRLAVQPDNPFITVSATALELRNPADFRTTPSVYDVRQFDTDDLYSMRRVLVVRLANWLHEGSKDTQRDLIRYLARVQKELDSRVPPDQQTP